MLLTLIKQSSLPCTDILTKNSNCKNIGEIRHLGCVSAIELVKDVRTKEPFDWKNRTGFQIFRKAIEKGAYLRNLGDVIYFMPPYVISEDEMIQLIDIEHESIYEVL